MHSNKTPCVYKNSISQVEAIVNEDSIYNVLSNAEDKILKSSDIRHKLSEFYLEREKKNQALAVKNCGTFLMFKEYKNAEKTAKLDKANFCKAPLCPLCSWRKSLKNSAIMSEAISNTRSYLYHLVLAVPNTPTIDKQDLMYIKKCATYFIKYHMGLESYVSNLEITRSDKGFHPHLHVILESPVFIRVSEEYIKKMAKLWKTVYDKADTEHEGYTFYIQGVKKDSDGLANELSKYALKHDVKVSQEDINTVAEAIHGVRRLASGGNFKKLLKSAKTSYEAEANEEAVELSVYDWEYRIFNYINGKFVEH